jgi:hypothetical protein
MQPWPRVDDCIMSESRDHRIAGQLDVCVGVKVISCGICRVEAGDEMTEEWSRVALPR